MANVNISNLTEKTTVNDSDVLLVEDSSSTNKVSKANLLKEVNAKIPTKVSQLTNDSGYLKSVPTEYITKTELNDKGYLTSIPGEYVTESELTAKGYLTTIPAEYITESELNAKGYLTEHQDISGKVDKVPGKSLIADTEISRLANVKNYDDTGIKSDISKKANSSDLHSHSNKVELDKIQEGDKAKWDAKSNFSGSYNDLTNKPTIPVVDVTKSYVDNSLGNKVDKVSGKGLSTNDYTTAEKTKLAGIAENANNYSLPMATNLILGGIKVSSSDPNLQVSDGVLSCKKNIPNAFTLPKLTKVDALAGETELATVITAFNNLIADLKAKGYMADA